jgi:hypothetical protein
VSSGKTTSPADRQALLDELLNLRRLIDDSLGGDQDSGDDEIHPRELAPEVPKVLDVADESEPEPSDSGSADTHAGGSIPPTELDAFDDLPILSEVVERTDAAQTDLFQPFPTRGDKPSSRENADQTSNRSMNADLVTPDPAATANLDNFASDIETVESELTRDLVDDIAACLEKRSGESLDDAVREELERITLKHLSDWNR